MSKVNNSAVQRNFFGNDKNAGIIQFPRFVYPQEELHKYMSTEAYRIFRGARVYHAESTVEYSSGENSKYIYYWKPNNKNYERNLNFRATSNNND